MRFGSVCSGIEAASVAWHPLGWQAAWLSEIEPFPSAVLAHHYPDVPNLGDMTTLPERILSGEIEAPDLFCGGTPCQAFSVAGLRNSLDDARGNLSLTFVGIANAIDTQRTAAGLSASIIFWENVPGVLSTKDNAFGCFLAALAGEDEPIIPSGEKWTNAGCVYGPQRAVAWRVLDAQYFGVAQRRRRVFVVASARDDFDPAAVLFEFGGVRRDTAPSREAGKTVAPTVTNGPPFRRTGNERVEAEAMVVQPYEVGNCLTARMAKGINSTVDEGQPPVISIHPHCIGRAPEAGPQGKEYLLDGSAYCMDSRGQPQAVAQAIAFAQNQRDEVRVMNVAGALAAEPGMKPQTYLAHEALYNQGLNDWRNRASTQETYSGKILRTLREAIGEKAFAKWGLGILDSLQSPEILRQALHGISVRPAAFSRSWVVYCALSRQKDDSYWLLQSLRETGSAGCPPQGWEPSEQLVSELGAYLSELSQPSAQAARFMRDLWWATQGPGVLREALSAVQEMGRPTHDQGKPTHGDMQVRRLTPKEAEFLQGFPNGYTNIPWRKKPEAPDGPRYKALGNSWAVPNVRWIGQRIQNHIGENT